MELWKSLPSILRQIILGAVLFVIGGALSFGYSYRPLHGALVWKVESLETRLDDRNREFLKLKDEIARFSTEESERVDPETLAQIESELAKTKQALRTAEKESKRVDEKRRDAIANADRWRKRYESLRDQQASMPAAKDPALTATPPPSTTRSPAEPASGEATAPKRLEAQGAIDSSPPPGSVPETRFPKRGDTTPFP